MLQIEYKAEFRSRGFQISMARRGNRYEDAIIASLFKTLKYE